VWCYGNRHGFQRKIAADPWAFLVEQQATAVLMAGTVQMLGTEPRVLPPQQERDHKQVESHFII